MPKFKVILNGRNLLLKMEKLEKCGVYIVRFVEAPDEQSAIQRALENFLGGEKGRELREQLLNSSDDPPVFECEEVGEVEFIDESAPPIGLMFYPEEAEEE